MSCLSCLQELPEDFALLSEGQGTQVTFRIIPDALRDQKRIFRTSSHSLLREWSDRLRDIHSSSGVTNNVF